MLLPVLVFYKIDEIFIEFEKYVPILLIMQIV